MDTTDALRVELPAERFAARRPAVSLRSLDRSAGAACCSSAACYWGRFDACTVVTLFPPWCWALIGVVARPGWRSRAAAGCRARFSPSAGWRFWSHLPTRRRAFVRAWLPQPERGTNLRVVSLNCAGVRRRRELSARFDPDIVLIQESPIRGRARGAGDRDVRIEREPGSRRRRLDPGPRPGHRG